MLIFRLVFGLLLLAGVLCFAMYIATGHPTWKRNGFIIVKWTVLAALAFFMVLILERLAVLLSAHVWPVGPSQFTAPAQRAPLR